MYHRVREIRGATGGKPIYAMDFQNDGEFVGGCIAGGRNYCHINANGDVEPCVFIHYSSANIKEVSLLEALKQPLFMAYRDHQPFNNNHLRPCPMLENPEILQEMVEQTEQNPPICSPRRLWNISAESVRTTPVSGKKPQTNCGKSTVCSQRLQQLQEKKSKISIDALFCVKISRKDNTGRDVYGTKRRSNETSAGGMF